MKTRISILLIVVGLLAVSCDDFLDVNSDPNNPTDVTPDLVLPVGLNYTATYVQEDRGLNHLGNMMMFNFGEAFGFSWYDQEFNYNVTSTFYDDLFDDAYSSSLKQYQVLASLPDEYGYYKAIGNIMKAYHFQILVDLYGDIPYSDALRRGGNANPTYNGAEAVYDSLLIDLSGAISTIETTEGSGSPEQVGDDDTIFGGNMDNWKSFANTIKIRILTRLSDTKDASFINSELDKITNSGYGYITDDVTINPGYVVEEDKQNPYWADFGTDVSGSQTLTYQATSATQFVIDHFQATNDTSRLDAIFEKPSSGHSGINQGAPNDDEDLYAPPVVSNLNLEEEVGILKGATMGSVILTLAEHKLNMAELAHKGFNVSQSAQEYYEAGVNASFDYLGASGADSYLAQGTENVSWSASTNKMNAIMTQKWIATMGVTAEQAWFDYSRTGYPNGQPTVSGGFPVSELASEDDRPVRLFYPSSEITRNGENVPTQPDAFSDPIFWATN